VLASRSPELESLGQGSRQLDLAVEPGEAEQLAGLAAVADHLEAAPVRGGAPGRADDRAESRGVHETDLIQVGDDMPAAVRQRVQALAQLATVAISISPATVTMAHPGSRRTRMVRPAFMTAHRPASARSRAAAAYTCLMIVCHPLHFSAWPGR
jgi:hypothetical protein